MLQCQCVLAKDLAAPSGKRPHWSLVVSGDGIEPLKFALAELVAIHRPIAVEPEPVASAKLKPSYPPPANSAKGRA